MVIECAALVLAAGGSTRFGGDKLSQMINGQPLLARIIDLFYMPVFVAIGGQYAESRVAYAQNARIITINDTQGMGDTIAQAVTRLPAFKSLAILPADLPLLDKKTIEMIFSDHKGRISRPRYNGRGGHPVIFDARFRAALENLSGAQGAAPIVAQNGCDEIEVQSAGIYRDMDTVDDAHALGLRS